MQKRDLVCVATISLLTLLLQVPLGFYGSVPKYDEAFYLEVSRNTLETGLPYRSQGPPPGTLSFRHPPLARYLTAVTIAPFDNHLLVARALTSFMSVLLLLLFFLFLKEAFSRSYAFLFALLLATQSLFLVHAHSLYVEVLLLTFCFAGFYYFHKHEKELSKKGDQRSLQPLIWSGIFLGLATCCKYTAGFYTLPLCAWLLLVRKRVYASVLLALLSLSFVGLWFLCGWFVHAEILVADLLSIRDVLVATAEHTKPNVTRTFFLFKELLPAIGPTLLMVPLLFFAILLIQKRHKAFKQFQDAPFLTSVAIVGLLVLVVFMMHYRRARYLVPIIPLLIYIAAFLTNRVQQLLSERTWSSWLPIAVFLLIVNSSSPLLDLYLQGARALTGRPRQFSGTYTETLRYSHTFAGIERVGRSMAAVADKSQDLFLSHGSLVTILHHYSGIHYCDPKACEAPALVVFDPTSAEQRDFVLTTIGTIKDYNLLGTFDNLGSRAGRLSLWQRAR